jgi:hypothetical protein
MSGVLPPGTPSGDDRSRRECQAVFPRDPATRRSATCAPTAGFRTRGQWPIGGPLGRPTDCCFPASALRVESRIDGSPVLMHSCRSHSPLRGSSGLAPDSLPVGETESSSRTARRRTQQPEPEPSGAQPRTRERSEPIAEERSNRPEAVCGGGRGGARGSSPGTQPSQPKIAAAAPRRTITKRGRGRSSCGCGRRRR